MNGVLAVSLLTVGFSFKMGELITCFENDDEDPTGYSDHVYSDLTSPECVADPEFCRHYIEDDPYRGKGDVCDHTDSDWTTPTFDAVRDSCYFQVQIATSSDQEDTSKNWSYKCRYHMSCPSPGVMGCIFTDKRITCCCPDDFCNDYPLWASLGNPDNYDDMDALMVQARQLCDDDPTCLYGVDPEEGQSGKMYDVIEALGEEDDCIIEDMTYKHNDILFNECVKCITDDEFEGKDTFCDNGELSTRVHTGYCNQFYPDQDTKCCQKTEAVASCIGIDEECIPDDMSSSHSDESDHGSILAKYEVFARIDFGDYGEIEIDENGNIIMNLDFGDFHDDLWDICNSHDDDEVFLLYHIHDNWNQDNNDVLFNDDCNSDLVGGHFNPFGKPECSTIDTEITYYNCEMGDLSGRFGALSITTDKREIVIEENLSYSMGSDGFCGDRLTPGMVYGRSVTFHCDNDDKTMIMCAPFTVIVDEAK